MRPVVCLSRLIVFGSVLNFESGGEKKGLQPPTPRIKNHTSFLIVHLRCCQLSSFVNGHATTKAPDRDGPGGYIYITYLFALTL